MVALVHRVLGLLDLLVEVQSRKASVLKKYLRWDMVTPANSVLLLALTTLGRARPPLPHQPKLIRKRRR